MVKVDRKFLLKLQITLGFVFIYFASFLSVFNIIYAYLNLVNGYPHPYYLALGVFLCFLVYIVFDIVVWSDIEELTKLKMKESDKNEEAKN
jgi:flagellar biosynthesis protein FlhB